MNAVEWNPALDFFYDSLDFTEILNILKEYDDDLDPGLVAYLDRRVAALSETELRLLFSTHPAGLPIGLIRRLTGTDHRLAEVVIQSSIHINELQDWVLAQRPKIREEVALFNTYLTDEFLRILSEDPSPQVRRAVAERYYPIFAQQESATAKGV